MQNPYGAVPEALQQTRLSLRDIMADMLATKKMEADLSLAKTKAETETALVGANIERDRLQNLKDIATITETSRHHGAIEKNAADTLSAHKEHNLWQRETVFPEEMRLKREDLASEDRSRRASAAASYASAAHSRAATAASAEERRRMNMVVSAGDFASGFGARHILPMFGIDENETRPAWQWQNMGKTIQSFMTQHPSAAILSAGYQMKSELESLASQYSTPGLDAKSKQALKEQIGTRLNQLSLLDQTIMSNKEPDPTKIAEAARRTWADNPQLQAQYGKYDEFLSDFNKDLQQARSHFKNDMLSIKFGLATKEIDPNYVETMRAAKQVIDSTAPGRLSEQIAQGTNRRLSEGDLAGAYKYQTNWAKYLQSQKSTGTAVPSPGNGDAARIWGIF